jgi:hypothetical protein
MRGANKSIIALAIATIVALAGIVGTNIWGLVNLSAAVKMLFR